MAEWLRRGLQILAPRFDSGSGLQSRFQDAQCFEPASTLRGLILLTEQSLALWRARIGFALPIPG